MIGSEIFFLRRWMWWYRYFRRYWFESASAYPICCTLTCLDLIFINLNVVLGQLQDNKNARLKCNIMIKPHYLKLGKTFEKFLNIDRVIVV